MLCLITSLLLLFGYSHQTSHGPKTDNIMYFSQRLEKVIQNKCLNNANDTVYENAIDGLHCFQNCWYLTLPEHKLQEEEFYKYCMSNTTIFVDCLENLVQQFEPCLEPQEIYLKDFILENYGNYNHYLCEFYAAEGSKKVNIDKCVDKFNDHPLTDPLTACYGNSTIFGHYDHLGLITQDKLCSDISNVQECYEKMFAAHCHDAPEFKELRMYFLNQGLEKCNTTASDL